MKEFLSNICTNLLCLSVCLSVRTSLKISVTTEPIGFYSSGPVVFFFIFLKLSLGAKPLESRGEAASKVLVREADSYSDAMYLRREKIKQLNCSTVYLYNLYKMTDSHRRTHKESRSLALLLIITV